MPFDAQKCHPACSIWITMRTARTREPQEPENDWSEPVNYMNQRTTGPENSKNQRAMRITRTKEPQEPEKHKNHKTTRTTGLLEFHKTYTNCFPFNKQNLTINERVVNGFSNDFNAFFNALNQ